MKVRNRHVGREEQIDALSLVDELLTVGRQLNDPALINFRSRLENILHILRNIVAMLNGAVVSDEICPHLLRIESKFGKLDFEEAVFHDVGAGDRVLTINVGAIRLDRGRRATHNERGRSIWRH